MSENLEDVDELVVTPKVGRSKYLNIIQQVEKYFTDHPDRKAVKVTKEYPADADTLRSGIKRWSIGDESFACMKEGRVVYGSDERIWESNADSQDGNCYVIRG